MSSRKQTRQSNVPVWPDNWRTNGGLWPTGVPVAQSWLEIGAILMAIQEYKVATMLELGTHRGGLVAVLAGRCCFGPPEFQIITVESRSSDWLDAATIAALRAVPRLTLCLEDAFGEPFLARARAAIQRPGGAFVYCDDGDKPREVRTYAPLLKPGDLIAAHDYAPGSPPHGPGAEITDADLAGLGAEFERLNPWWLEGTSICLFRRRRHGCG